MLTPLPQADALINGDDPALDPRSPPPRLSADIGAFLRASWFRILLFTGIFMAGAAAYLSVTPPVFIAAAQLLIDRGRLETAVLDGGRAETDTFIESQIEIIKSAPVAAAVVKKLRLFEDHEFLKSPPSLMEEARLWLGGVARAPAGTPELRAAEILRAKLMVRRTGQSTVVEIAFPYGEPADAARIANAVAEAYIHQDIEVKSQAAERASRWLAERVAALREQTYDSMRALERYKREGERGQEAELPFRLAELETVSQSHRKLYETYLERHSEMTQKVSYAESDARFVSVATPPLNKSHPRKGLILAFITLAGMAAGIVFSTIRYTTDRRIRSANRLAGETGVPCLGALARVPGRSSKREPWAPRIGIDASAAFVSDVRNLRAAINATMPERRSRCLGVVACARGEGSSTVAINLALLGAMSGTRTLLIDACPERPTVSRTFAPQAEIGLMQALEDAAVAAKLPVAMAAERLVVLPIGRGAGLVTPGDRLSSERTPLQIDDLREQFDLVIFDLPPLDTSSDAYAIAPYLDGVVLVGEFASTTLDSIAATASALRITRANLLGVVLTKTPASGKGRPQ